MIGSDTETTSISLLVYVPNDNDVDGYQAEIREIFVRVLGMPVSNVTIDGPTITYYHRVVADGIGANVDIPAALIQIDIALAESNELPEGTALVNRKSTSYLSVHK